MTEELEGERSNRKESRKALTVRENVKLIEASSAQLFLVAVQPARSGCEDTIQM